MIPSYARFPVEFVRGEGARLWDSDGDEYLDFLCGISVTSLGHCHPRVVAAVREQVGRLMHASNLFYTEPAMRLPSASSESSLGGKVYFCNSGAEANEAAIKLARKAKPAWRRRRRATAPSTGAPTARCRPPPRSQSRRPSRRSSPASRRSPPTPTRSPPRSTSAPPPCCWSRSKERPASTCSPRSCCASAREACDEHGAALVFDEIQCGMGRTGTLWAYEQTGVTPDAITTAKALGGGLPIGALVTGPRSADVLQPGDHGSTFAGGPVVAAAALAALEVTSDPGPARARAEAGASLADGLARSAPCGLGAGDAV